MVVRGDKHYPPLWPSPVSPEEKNSSLEIMACTLKAIALGLVVPIWAHRALPIQPGRAYCVQLCSSAYTPKQSLLGKLYSVPATLTTIMLSIWQQLLHNHSFRVCCNTPNNSCPVKKHTLHILFLPQLKRIHFIYFSFMYIIEVIIREANNYMVIKSITDYYIYPK